MLDRYRIVTAADASTDLERIFDSIAKGSPQNASRVIERILTAIESLKTFPASNKDSWTQRQGRVARAVTSRSIMDRLFPGH